MSAMASSELTLYTAATPNGIKISIALQILGLSYKIHPLELSTNAQKEPWYLEINPNGRIPAITDILPNGEKIRIFESGSILLYLAERYDSEHKISYPNGTPEHYETISWLFFQNAGLGPMQGQANHFRRYAPEPETKQYSIDRYSNETRRLYRVLENHLSRTKTKFLVGDRPTIADFSTFSWVWFADWAGIDMGEFPTLEAWKERVYAIPGVKRGTEIPKVLDLKHMSKQEQDEYAKSASKWITQGAKEVQGVGRG